MKFNLHPNIKIQELYIGEEKLPILVIDNFVDNAELLIESAASNTLLLEEGFYPGIRAPAPKDYQALLLQSLEEKLITFFDINTVRLNFSVCHYSMVTKTPDQLKLLQRIPHFDSPKENCIAAVHYLFQKDLGGTSFYRHKKTKFESINEAKMKPYFSSLESENGTNNIPKSGYINSDTALYEKISEQKGVFNRIIFYRRNALHSGSIDKQFTFDSSPLTGRLTIASFLDPML